jgi:BirA family biotin operon repressor/biotin-[acetyl-CoA-carboxylase] ligase
LENQKDYSIEDTAMKLIDFLQSRFNQLQIKNLTDLKNQYLKLLWLLNKSSLFEDENGIFEGKIIGTDEYGRLILERDSISKTYDLKEIKFLDRNASVTLQTCN